MKIMLEKWSSSNKLRYGALVGLLFTALFGYTLYYFWGQAQHVAVDTIVDQLSKLVTVFEKIDSNCKILGFDLDKTPINFLTVSRFAGSEVGSMNLAYPDKWEGPYVERNPTIDGKYYYVLTSKNGYFIVPGDGVKLSDGKVLGKDIIITPRTDIEDLIKRTPSLTYKGHSLIVPLTLKQREQLLAKLQVEAYGVAMAE